MDGFSVNFLEGDEVDPRSLRSIVIARSVPTAQRIEFIRVIRAIAGVGLAEAKAIAEAPPPLLLCLATSDAAYEVVAIGETLMKVPGLFEVYPVDTTLRPASPRVVVPANLISVSRPGAGCTTQTAAVLGIGLVIYFVLI